tara:strand:- start:675 stop:1973 length:1299 start_codon:yes stop_codon:yes gene_type:complete
VTREPFTTPCAIKQHQLGALNQLITTIASSNQFYGSRLVKAGLDTGVQSLEEFCERMPFTLKMDLIDDQHSTPPYGTNLTYAIENYMRFCQTSGTTDQPMVCLDTPEDWQWMLDNWLVVLDAAGVHSSDRALFAFSFGPFLGFWTAFEAAAQKRVLCVPGGGMSSEARLRLIIDHEMTLLFCTPTYAIRLAEVARETGLDISRTRLKRIIVAGETGGSVTSTRRHIARLWPGADVFDHHGMTEVGPVSFQNLQHPGVLHVIESAYMAEIVDADNQQSVQPGQVGELVLTTLGRHGAPLLRYRTGDLVRQSTLDCSRLGRPEMALEGGILGRCDDMILVRGVNVYPSAVDHVIHKYDEIAEYQVEVHDGQGLTELQLLIEPQPQCQDVEDLCGRLSGELRNVFQLRVPVIAKDPGELPRFEMKAKRWIRIDRN